MPCKRCSAEPPLAAVGGLIMGRMLHRAFALIISVGVSLCKEVCMFIKDEIAWRKNKPEFGCQIMCSIRNIEIDIEIKNRAGNTFVISVGKTEMHFNL